MAYCLGDKTGLNKRKITDFEHCLLFCKYIILSNIIAASNTGLMYIRNIWKRFNFNLKCI